MTRCGNTGWVRGTSVFDAVTSQFGKLPLNSVGAQFAENVELPLSRGVRPPIREIDDHTLVDTVDGRMRFVDEAPKAFGQPVIPPGLAAVAVHALLDHDPASIVGDDEAVEIEVEAVLDRRAVDLGDEPARPGERCAVEAGPIADRDKLMRRLARVVAAAAADMDAEFPRQRCQTALQRSDDARGDTGGMPVHSHHRTE